MMASCSSLAVKLAEGESTREPNWLELPRDVTAHILHKLGVVEILTSARNVCPLWWNICKDPLMWRTIDMSNLCLSRYDLGYLAKICRYAVDQSCGHLEDINIEHFGNDNLLKYISDSASHLRRIRLAQCWAISDIGLSEAVKKLPLLEEFDISFSFLSKHSLEAIGQCCPFLKALKFNMEEAYGPVNCDDDDEAFAIAKNMPGLRHLQLVGNQLTNDGLLAILDGCPRLESLDLRGCFNVDLRGSLGKRCHEQIKDLQLPNDYVDDGFYGDDSYLDSPSENSYGHSFCDFLDGYESAYWDYVDGMNPLYWDYLYDDVSD